MLIKFCTIWMIFFFVFVPYTILDTLTFCLDTKAWVPFLLFLDSDLISICQILHWPWVPNGYTSNLANSCPCNLLLHEYHYCPIPFQAAYIIHNGAFDLLLWYRRLFHRELQQPKKQINGSLEWKQQIENKLVGQRRYMPFLFCFTGALTKSFTRVTHLTLFYGNTQDIPYKVKKYWRHWRVHEPFFMSLIIHCTIWKIINHKYSKKETKRQFVWAVRQRTVKLRNPLEVKLQPKYSVLYFRVKKCS